MANLRLNKDNNFRMNATANLAECTFLVNGTTADVEVHVTAGGALVGRKTGITAGNIAKINGLAAGTQYTYQINPMDSKTGNATVTYEKQAKAR